MLFVPVSNGQGGMNLIPVPTPALDDAPTSYEGTYTTEGVEVKVTYKTSNKAIVDSIEKKLIDSGWTFNENKNSHEGALVTWFGILAVTFFGVLAFLAITVAGAVLAELGDFITFNQLDRFMTQVIRVAIIGFLVINSAATIYLILANIKELFTKSK